MGRKGKIVVYMVFDYCCNFLFFIFVVLLNFLESLVI